MTEAIIWGVLWLVFIPLGAWLAVALGIAAGGLIGIAADRAWIAILVAVLGWIAAIAWVVFAAVHLVLQVIAIVQLAVAG